MRRYSLKRKMNEYAYSFTIHGLSRIASGNKKEKIIWAIFISSAVATAAYLIQGYIKTYLKHEVYQDLTAMKVDTMYFPSVTFCLVSPKYILNNNYEPKCKIPKRKLKESSDFLTANSFFAVASCEMDRMSGCYQDDGLIHFREDMKHACFTWHPQRKFFQRERGMYIKFLVDDTVGRHDEVSVTIHDQDIDPMFLTPQLSISPEKRYLLKITKRITKRLPQPFPSKCSNKTKDHHFPGAYDRETCVAVNRNIEIFKKHEEFSDLGKYSLQRAMGDKFNLSKYRDGFTRIALDRFLNDVSNTPFVRFHAMKPGTKLLLLFWTTYVLTIGIFLVTRYCTIHLFMIHLTITSGEMIVPSLGSTHHCLLCYTTYKLITSTKIFII